MYFRPMPLRVITAVGTGLLVLTASACEFGVVDSANGQHGAEASSVIPQKAPDLSRGDGRSLGRVSKPSKSPKPSQSSTSSSSGRGQRPAEPPKPPKSPKPSKPAVPSPVGEPIASIFDCEGREVIVQRSPLDVGFEWPCPWGTVIGDVNDVFIH